MKDKFQQKFQKFFLKNTLHFSHPSEGWDLKKTSKIILAISGGADSMALAHMYKSCENFPLAIAITVDHNLRKNSAEEAEKVGKWMNDFRLPHRILKLQNINKSGNLEENARIGRYKLLIEFAKKNNAEAILVAHHKDDQIESFFLALNRGSGVKGLSGMSEIREQNGVKIIRPFLDFSKKEILNYCDENSIPFVNDPMNFDEKFDRVKIRKNISVLEKLGTKKDRIILAIKNLQRSQNAIDFYVEKVLQKIILPNGNFLISPILESPDEISLRVLAKLIQQIGEQAYSPKLEKLESLLLKIKEKKSFQITLGKCIILVENNILKMEKE